MIGNSRKWAYIRIITGTIVGGVLGFYVMHRVELSYKVGRISQMKITLDFFSSVCVFVLICFCVLGVMQEKMKERLKQYENELKKKEQIKEVEDSV